MPKILVSHTEFIPTRFPRKNNKVVHWFTYVESKSQTMKILGLNLTLTIKINNLFFEHLRKSIDNFLEDTKKLTSWI